MLSGILYSHWEPGRSGVKKKAFGNPLTTASSMSLTPRPVRNESSESASKSFQEGSAGTKSAMAQLENTRRRGLNSSTRRVFRDGEAYARENSKLLKSRFWGTA